MRRLALIAILIPSLTALACGGSGFPKSVQPAELDALLAAPEGPLLLDVRSIDDFLTGHLPGAKSIPADALADRLGEFEEYRERGIVVVDQTGDAGAALDALRDGGFKKVGQLAGGFERWKSEDRPVEFG